MQALCNAKELHWFIPDLYFVYMCKNEESILKSLLHYHSWQHVSQYAKSPWHVKSRKVKKKMDGNQFSFFHLYSLHRYSISLQNISQKKLYHRLNSWHWPTHLDYLKLFTCIEWCYAWNALSFMTYHYFNNDCQYICQNLLFSIGCMKQVSCKILLFLSKSNWLTV